ncbi:Serine/threonine-protein phosphatase T [Candida viswanathii]|uniref:Serine/threonine-protein phosphatase n=1 Tax=Candida viswanathii TaxID=5486 RepID=A0A367YNE1_9ASCO|nr:Serine/threonine-protein phosphatase T [Candida viswanathii]
MTKEEAIKLKDQGNAYLKDHKYDQAIESYTQAIALDPQNAIFYSNRAQVHIKLENYGLAIQDCDAAIAIDPGFLKAYYRKGVSLMAILQYKQAQLNFKLILNKLPGDKLTVENYKQCTNYLKRQAFEKAIAGTDHTLVINSVDYQSIQIEKSWEGPELKITPRKSKDGEITVEIDGLDEGYLKYMIKLFKDGGKLPKKHVFAIITKVYELLKKEKTMTEITLEHSQISDKLNDDEIIGGKKLTVVGDTHGQFYDLLNLFTKFGHVSKDHVFLFNGDFVDRGSWSCEVALYLYVLKILYPTSIFINRGNHETSDMNKTYGFTDECEYKYSKKIFEAFTESFGALPLASLINREYLCMHGGLFSNDKVTLADIKSINRFPTNGSTQPPKEGLAMELLWTDPQEVNGRSPSKRGIGMQFGPDVTERFCLNNKIRKILRSHEVRMGGVEEEQKGRLITVFSAPNYCDSTGNLGGIVNFEENKNYDKEKDNGEGYRDVNDSNTPWALTTETFEAVPHPDMKPMAYSKGGFGF